MISKGYYGEGPCLAYQSCNWPGMEEASWHVQ